MPQEILNYITKNFNAIYGSPFSKSFYSKKGQTWDNTPYDQIRVSDHWNFYSRDYSLPEWESPMTLHAKTDIDVKVNHWTIAKYNNKGVYEVILSLPKREVISKIYINKNDLLQNKQPNEILYQLKVKKIKNKEKQLLDKIAKGKQWISFDRIYTERVTAKRFVKIEERNKYAILVKETPSFFELKDSEKGTIYKYKKTTLSNIKYLNRKPKI